MTSHQLPSGHIRVGVDIGGTFTDIVLLHPDNRLDRIKILTDHHNYAASIAVALVENADRSC